MHAFFIIFLSFILSFVNVSFVNPANADNNISVSLRKAIKIIQNEYVIKQNDTKLFKMTLEGLLNQIDPYAEYLTEDDLENIKLNTKGEIYGIGMQLEYKNRKFLVGSVVDGYPASKSKIKPGDVILLINEKSVENYSLDQIITQIENSKREVGITVNRNGKKIKFLVEKSLIKIPSVIAKVKDNILYIKILQFNQMTAQMVRQILEGQKNILGIIIDLRNNNGGLFNEAIAVANIFLKSGEIVSTVNFNHNKNKKYYAQAKNTVNYFTPMVVLVNKFSASSSEIVAGALKFNNRAILIGERTYGKGSIQTIIPLDCKLGAIKITTAYYKLPNGQFIENRGIDPDIKALDKYDDRDEFINVALNKLKS